MFETKKNDKLSQSAPNGFLKGRRTSLEQLEERQLLAVTGAVSALASQLTDADAYSSALVGTVLPTSSSDTIVVDTNLDVVDDSDGVTSLREAIAAASDGMTIAFDENLGETTIVVSSLLTIDNSIAIDGGGRVTLDGNYASQLFHITVDVADVPVELRNITMKKAHGNYSGSAIFNEGNLVLTNTLVSKNSSSAGALVNNGTLTIANSVFSENSGGSSSGAIENNGTLTIVNSTFFDNSTSFAGGAIENNGTLTVANSSFYDNRASYYGGAICSWSGAKVTVTNSSFYDNWGLQRGGAYYGVSDCSFINCTIAGNKSASGGGVCLYDSSYSEASPDFCNTIVCQNYSPDATCNVNVSLPDAGNNLIDAEPGFVVAPVFEDGYLVNANVLDLHLGEGSAAIGAGDVSRVCGDYDVDGNARMSGASVNIGAYEGLYKTIVVDSALDAPYDGKTTLRKALASAPRGAKIVFAESLGETTITLSDVIILDKPITIDGGGRVTLDADNNSRIFTITGGDEYKPVELRNISLINGYASDNGGAIYNRSDNLVVSNVSFSGNSAANGGAIYDEGNLVVANSYFSYNLAGWDGGALVKSSGDLSITGSSFIGNSAKYEGAVDVGYSGTLTIANSIFSENSAESDGAIGNSGELTITNSTFFGNIATEGGGGAIGNGGELTIIGSTFSDNEAVDYCGGAIDNYGVLSVANSSFIDNIAAATGGAIYDNSSTTTVENSSFIGNSAVSGGAIGSGGELTITGSTFSGNSVKNEGGAIYVGGIATVTNSTFSGNTAKDVEDESGNGGAIYNSWSDLTVVNSTFSGNSATSGGAIYNIGQVLTVANSLFFGNSAEYGGAAIGNSAWGADSLICNCTISGNRAANGSAIDGWEYFDVYNSIVSQNFAVEYYQNPDIDVWFTDSEDNWIGGDPGFVVAPVFDAEGYLTNADELDLRLRFTSTAIDAGKNDYVYFDEQDGSVPVDLDGNPRIFGTSVDYGAYEANLIVVDTNLDAVDPNDGATSLREAIAAAIEGTTIVFAETLGETTITLTSELTIDQTITIDGDYRVTLDANNNGRVFNVADVDAEQPVVLRNMTLVNGASNECGGAIYNSGVLTAENLYFSGNTALSGGAIGNEGVLKLVNSAFSDNEAEYGGALWGGSIDIYNSTISGNKASVGGGVFIGAGEVYVYNSIVCMNYASEGADIYGETSESVNNYFDADPGFVCAPNFDADGNLLNANDIDLCLLSDSIAIDAGDSAYVAADFDIVGNPRVVNKSVDLGAYEDNAIVVDTNLDAVDPDDGLTSLREALAASFDGATVVFAESLEDTTITLSSVLTIDKAITIDGGNRVVLDGNNETRVLYITGGNESQPVELRNITLANGTTSECGGAVYNEGVLSVVNAAFSGNASYYEEHSYEGEYYYEEYEEWKSGDGGAIYNVGVMTVANSTFDGNTAEHFGGAVANEGVLTVANTAFFGNTAGWYGGALSSIYCEDGLSVINIYNSTISGNTAEYGGGVYSESGRLNVYNTIAALNCDWSSSDIYGELSADVNNLIGGDPGFVAAPVWGYDSDYNYVLLNVDSLNLRLHHTSNAIDAGCDDFVFTDFDLDGNSRVVGPAVDLGAYEFRPIVVDTNLDVVDPEDGLTSLREAIAAAPDGGLIVFAESLGETTIVLGSELTIDKTIAIDGGNRVVLDGTRCEEDGDDETWDEEDEEIWDEEYEEDAPTDFSLFVVSGGDAKFPVELRNMTLANGHAYEGGAIYNAGNLVVENLTFSGNQSDWNGGVIYNDHGTLKVSNSAFSGNQGGYNGGAIYNYDGTLTVADSTFSDNSASYGGTIYNSNGRITVENSSFSGNTSQNSGGAIYSYGALTVANSSFSGNSASYGGAVYFNSNVLNSNISSAKITDSTFTDNSSSCGGAIYTVGVMYVASSSFVGNSASVYGGAIESFGSSYSRTEGGRTITVLYGALELSNSSFVGNTSTKGGAVCNWNSASLYAASSVFFDNSAEIGGAVYGGLYYSGSSYGINLYNCTIAGNTAETGGGVYNERSINSKDIVVYNTIVSQNHASTNPDVYGWLDSRSSNNIVGGDPQFVVAPVFDAQGVLLNAIEVDLHLSLDSAAIDAGDSSKASPSWIISEFDLDGNPRIISESVDIGAYEAYAGEIASVAISGKVAVGSKLTATAAPADSAVKYQWYVSETPDGELTPIDGANSKSYTISAACVDKYISVKATGVNAWCGTTSATTPTVVAAAKLVKPNVKAEPTASSIALSWKAIANASQYYVQYKTASASSYKSFYTDDTNAVVEGLVSSTTYNVRVKAVPSDPGYLKSDYTTLTATTLTIEDKLAAPTDLAVSAVTATRATLSWTPVENACGYRVSYVLDGSDDVVVACDRLQGTTYRLEGLTKLSSYAVSVVALGDGENYGDSDPGAVSLTTIDSKKLAKPNVNVSATDTSISLSWKAIANAVKYYVRYKPSSASSYTAFYTTEKSCVIDGLDPSTSYNVQVKAVPSNPDYKNSNYTAKTAATTIGVKVELSSLKATTAALSWNNVPGAQSYSVQFRETGASAFTEFANVTQTNCAISGLTAETSYECRVVAIGDGSVYDELASDVKPFTTTAVKKLSKPVVSNTTTDVSATISWKPVANAVKYLVRYKAASSSSYITFGYTTETSVTLDGLNPSTKYNVQVKAVPDDPDYKNSDYTNASPTTLAPLDQAFAELASEESDDLFGGLFDEFAELFV